MDNPSAPCKARDDELKRLSTFGRWPIQSGLCSGITNSPSKLAGAYFERKDGAVEDEVYCKDCGVTFSNWENENPAAVHRVISPKCPSLNTPPADESYAQSSDFLQSLQESPFRKYLPPSVQKQFHPETPPTEPDMSAANHVRRQLFTFTAAEENTSGLPEASETAEVSSSNPASVPQTDSARQSSVLTRPVIKHPFKPVTANYDDLFASVRLKTYPGTFTQQNQAWAEEGFVFCGDGSVQCVFCGRYAVRNGLHPHSVHTKMNPSCPFVMGIDTGNIACKQEQTISMKYMMQQNSKNVSLTHSPLVVKHPHYANEDVRRETFRNWPRMCSFVFPADLMCSAGFYYSGCADKVVCYVCGIEMYNWDREADVWKHHANLSPSCQFVVRHMDQHFIDEAAGIEVLVDVKYPGDHNASVTDNGTVVAEEVGSSTLDLTAVKAALACRYPNKAILLASLKAADENHITICEQQQVLQEKDTKLQEKDTQFQTVIQEKDTQLQTVIQEKDTVIQEKDTVIQEKDTQLQTVIQEKDTQLQTVIQEKDTQLQTVIQEKDAYAAHLAHQLQMQDQQIQSLMQQVQQLRADRRPPNNAVPGPAGDGAQPGANMDSRQRLLCKICLTEESNMIFLPCGHVTSCVSCASRLPDKRCPVCRRDISEILPAFVV